MELRQRNISRDVDRFRGTTRRNVREDDKANWLADKVIFLGFISVRISVDILL